MMHMDYCTFTTEYHADICCLATNDTHPIRTHCVIFLNLAVNTLRHMYTKHTVICKGTQIEKPAFCFTT